MKQLILELKTLQRNSRGDANIINAIEQDQTLFPFGMANKLLAYLLSIGEITYERYLEIINNYYSRNRYINLFEMSPRTFGQTWGEKHIRSLFPQFIEATKENLATVYPNFDGEFDLWLDGIRIEVKACRANDTKSDGSLATRAYLHSEAQTAST